MLYGRDEYTRVPKRHLFVDEWICSKGVRMSARSVALLVVMNS